MKRKEGESFDAYRERQKSDDKAVKKYLVGKRIKYTKKEARNKARATIRGEVNHAREKNKTIGIE